MHLDEVAIVGEGLAQVLDALLDLVETHQEHAEAIVQVCRLRVQAQPLAVDQLGGARVTVARVNLGQGLEGIGVLWVGDHRLPVEAIGLAERAVLLRQGPELEEARAVVGIELHPLCKGLLSLGVHAQGREGLAELVVHLDVLWIDLGRELQMGAGALVILEAHGRHQPQVIVGGGVARVELDGALKLHHRGLNLSLAVEANPLIREADGLGVLLATRRAQEEQGRCTCHEESPSSVRSRHGLTSRP